MSTPPWLQAQRSAQQQQQQQQQQYKPAHPLIFRSATPPPLRPRSAAGAPNSPPRGRHVIPRSHSVLHARPPSAPRLSTASPAFDLDQHRQPIVCHPQAGAVHVHEQQQQQQGSDAMGIGSPPPVHVDYSAIQRIADGVERMVRSWTSENSCRAQVYAKAYDSLHAAVARGKEQASSQHQHHPPQLDPLNHPSVCTEPSPFKLKSHSDACGAHQPLSVHNLQSPADPNLVEITPCIYNDSQHPAYDTHPVDEQQHTSSAHLQYMQDRSNIHGSQTSYAGHGGGYNTANLSIGAPFTATRITSRSQQPVAMDNGLEIVYTEGPPRPIGQDSVKKLKTGNNMCVHNRTHNYPIGLSLINENDDTEQKSGNQDLPSLGHYELDGTQAEYDSRDLARIQQGRVQQGDQLAESGLSLHLQPQYQRSNQLQISAPFARNDQFNSNSSTKCNARSRSPSSIRLGTLANTHASHSLEVYHHEGCKIERRMDGKYEAKVKELEISLLECATEYEVQLVEMKMKMLQMKSEFRQKTAPEENRLALCKPLQTLTQDAQNNSKPNRHTNTSLEVPVEQGLEQTNLKRRVHKEKYSENVPPNKPKTSKVDGVLRKSSSEDSGKIVTCLQKLLSKKEQELLNSKLREKELAGQIHELQSTVQRGRVTQMEPKKLLSLLLALNEWLQSVKAGVVNADTALHRRAYQNVHALAHLRMNLEEPQLANQTNTTQSPRLENLATIVNKEIKTLQEILGKLTPHRKKTK